MIMTSNSLSSRDRKKRNGAANVLETHISVSTQSNNESAVVIPTTAETQSMYSAIEWGHAKS